MAEMPLADTGGVVAGFVKHIRNRHFIGVQSVVTVGKQHGLHAESLVVTTGHQRGS